MKTYPASYCQLRALIAAGISTDANRFDSQSASLALIAANLRGDGIPAGKTWRTTYTLDDAALLAAIAIDSNTDSRERNEGRDTY